MCLACSQTSEDAYMTGEGASSKRWDHKGHWQAFGIIPSKKKNCSILNRSDFFKIFAKKYTLNLYCPVW